MRYALQDPITVVKGIGATVQKTLETAGIHTVLDLVLQLPYRYEDRSQIVTIGELKAGEQATVRATVLRANISYRGRRTVTRATIQDLTGQLQCIWFNNRFVMNQLKQGAELYFAGKLNDRGMLAQPTVEKVSDDTVHTARLVPLYTQLSKDLKIGTLRRILKEVTDNLEATHDAVSETLSKQYPPFIRSIQELHFPSVETAVPPARERLALEELLGLIQYSQSLKEQWKEQHNALALTANGYDADDFSRWLPKSIPFALTQAQQRATREIMADLQNDTAMNRLLVGDVGSGKTVVAGIACSFVLQDGHNAVLIAPTQILAQQHAHSLQELFPDLSIQLVTGQTSRTFSLASRPTLYVGTHAVLHHLETIQPVLMIYDEQHRFGVQQRTPPNFKHGTPHMLTLSATPIPRTLMLTLFSHLQLSALDEMPAGRKPVTTWLVPASKHQSSLKWIGDTVQKTNGQALIVCPFIEPSSAETLGNVAAATEHFEKLKTYYGKHFPNLKLGLLHGKLKATEKQAVIDATFAKKIDILITTPVVEVGVDLPAANVMVIEAAERFGLASLHQLRGRVGRRGQESFCMVFPTTPSKTVIERLKKFTQEHNGLKLAEQDLQNRGAGDLFGFRQHGMTDLRFADWADLTLIQDAHQAYQALTDQPWQSLLPYRAPAEFSPASN